ncbi:MAG: hypothetical protein U0800_18835 [Isosphaeraceae bacterium]
MSRFVAVCWLLAGGGAWGADEPSATREFSIRGDRAYLAGEPIKLWGIRCGNALMSRGVTERHVNALDAMKAHGINLIGAYIQGSNGGSPNPEAGFDGFRRDGRLKPEVAERLEWLIREADKRGMVVMVGVLSPRKDQDLYDEAAIRRAIEEAARFLESRKLRNVFVDLMHEYNNADRIDHELLREPGGADKKSKLAGWFRAIAPEIETGVCPSQDTGTDDQYPGMDVRIIQKSMGIPSTGFVVNVELTRHDFYENDGIFSAAEIASMKKEWEQYRDAPNAAMLFHSAYVQGISNKSGSAPNPEPGGYGTGPNDRGVRFFFDWLRDNVGPWEFPRHRSLKEGGVSR